MSKLEYLLKQYENFLGWYRQSEEKAKFLVSINTLVVGVVNGLVFIGADKVRNVQPLYTWPIWLLLGVSGISLVSSYLFVLHSMWPRQRLRESSAELSERLWFFGDIADMTKRQHAAAMAEWTDAGLERSLIAQNHALAGSVLTKHESLNWAIACTIGALIALFALGV